MSRKRLALAAWAVLLAACAKSPVGEMQRQFDASVACEDRDHDGYGRDCERGYDCNDDDPRSTTECRTCSRPERGCACSAGEGPVSCFMDDQSLEGGDVLCTEGTRHCREGVWSGCEDVHQYIAAPASDTQRVIDPNAGKLPCSICDVKCFQIVDNLLSDGGVAGGNVAFGPGGGITLLPGDGGTSGPGTDGGSSGLTGCAAMTACCTTLSDELKTSCDMTAMAGDNTVCERDRFVYCPSGTINGPVTGCTIGVGADKDCDGIPDVVDAYPGKPLSTSSNQAIFHQLDVGETGENKLELSFKLKNADVYFLMDMTNTMKEERDNLISSLTTGNVVNCAHLNQCCNRESNASKKASCQAAVDSYTNRPGRSDDQNACLIEQSTYCPGNKPVDCPDGDGNGVADNFLKTQGVVGATRCLVGSSWFGAGFTREAPIGYDPNGCSGSACSTRYGDRDEQLFKNLVDLTPDYTRVSTALQSMLTNGNVDEPEGGLMGLHSLITGKGHYFGINRPSIPTRSATTSCPPNSFGYPCFRKDAVPIVVFFTDRPHHNGPNDPTSCNGQGQGCPYGGLSKGATPNTWISGVNEGSSDKVARFVPPSAETFTTAYNVGDVRGQYYTLVGDTRFMAGDYPPAIVGCGAEAAAPDALIRFRVTAPTGSTGTVPPIPINFHLTKDDAYSASLYGTWNASRTNDPSPATEFGSVLTVYRGVPSSVSSSTDLGDRQAYAIASGPDSTYLTYTGTTKGMNSAPGYLGGISGCSADGLTNQMLFTFRPTGNARIVVDASGSAFPAVVSLHQGLPSSLPRNPSTTDGTSAAIANTNDTFATANAVPSGSTSIDGAYVERTGDSNVSAIKADYTAPVTRYVFAQRTADSDTLTNVSSTNGLYVGMELASSSMWSATPVRVASFTASTVKLSGVWEGVSDPATTQIGFVDTLVGCGVDPAGKDSVFKFNVATPRRVRIDTEGSTFDTVISLHDAPPPTVITKTDVGGNATAPGYTVGDVSNSSVTVSDVGMGTNAFASNVDYQQCGAVKNSKDAVLNFTLSKPTHLGLDVTGAWNPVVGLFSSKPGFTTIFDNQANNNDRLTAPSAAVQLGDIYGAVDTTVLNSNLQTMSDDYAPAVVGCDAMSPSKDQIFTFTPLANTRARVTATPVGSSWEPIVAVFDDPPPSSAAIPTSVAFDASTVNLPDSNCVVYSYHDPALTSAPAHTYAICPSNRYANDANARCVGAGMSYLVSINTAAEQDFLMNTSIPLYLGAPFHIGARDPGGSGPGGSGTFGWRDGSPLTGYSNWATGEPNGQLINNKCADLSGSGTWIDGKCDSSGASSLTDNVYYICEDDTPYTSPNLHLNPNEDAATAYTIADPGTAGNAVRVVTGSTRRMSSDYNGATLLSACGGTISGGDAVFKITTSSTSSYTLGVDSAGSSYNVVLGLFEGTIDAAGYKACDAPAGGSLTYSLLPSREYYILVKGSALSQEGSYKLKFSNMTATVPNGTRLACGRASVSATTASVDVDVDANHKYYVVVDQASSLFGKYDLEVHSLYQTRAEVGNATSRNETGSNALSLPDPYRSRITVVDTSTSGMTADYAALPMCTSSASAPDAVYKFTPSLSTNVTFTVAPTVGSTLSKVGVGVFNGPPATSAVVKDLNASGNLNEAATSAEVVSLTGPAQQYNGNTSGMSAHVDPSMLACGARPNGKDAVFSFNLTKQTSVEIDASASAVSDPVINLLRASPLSRPSQVTLENDTKSNADAAPSPTPQVSSAWLYYGADFNHLSADSQVASSVAAVNDDAPPGTRQPQDLGDVAGKRFVISGGDTSGMRADFPGSWSCGGNDASPDAIYKFYSTSGGSVHVKATPQTGFDGVIGLFDGTNGPPLRLSDLGSVTEDTACVPANDRPRNVTNSTLKSINSLLAAAPDINLSCGSPATIVTDDPDGSGSAIVSFSNWCGTQPTILVQPQIDGPELIVFVTKNLQIASGNSLRVLGSRPVLFVVGGNAAINGQLSASPNALGTPGAGGDFGCGLSHGGGSQNDGTNSGGGGGGGFGTAGGVGGFGTSSTVAGGLAGVARTNTTLVPLVGGCGGGNGSFGSAGGLPGGAVQISATGNIVLAATTGLINVDGAVGNPGDSGQAGGTGGGSGGGILLQAQTITVPNASQLSARGGNGGQGLGSPASNGGTGSTTNASAGNVGTNGGAAAGGGGGGGGFGRIVLVSGTAVTLAPCTTATNENASSAWPLMLDSSGRQYIEQGNTSSMTADHPGMCGAPAGSKDAVYAFTLSKQSTIQIDARQSATNAVVGLYNASSLGVTPTLSTKAADTREEADLPLPAANASNNWLAYSGDLKNYTPSSQPQTTVDNAGNKNEIIPTELPDPIDRRITVTNASTASMTPDFLAASCSMPAADQAKDALFRFVPSKSGPVRVSANYSQTTFDPVIALYRGAHNVIDEPVFVTINSDAPLKKLNVDPASVKVYNAFRTVLYASPADYTVVVKDAKTPVVIKRSSPSSIPDQTWVSVDYVYDSGAPLPVSQQQLTPVTLPNTNENVASAVQVPILSDRAYVYSGDTTMMTSDIDGSLFTCGPPATNARDATFAFSLDKSTAVSITTEGSAFDTNLAVFSAPPTRPSTTELRSPAAVLTQLYDASRLPGSPEAGCTTDTYGTSRYWYCAKTPRPWEQAEGMCQTAGLHLATIDNAAENNELQAHIQAGGLSHHIGLTQNVPYTNSWGSWTSGGGGSTGMLTGSYARWADKEPNGNGNCLQMIADGTWDDADCAVVKNYVCESENNNTTAVSPAGSTCGARFVIGTRSYFVCTDKLDWITAAQRCSTTSMHLATVDSENENGQIRAQLSGAQGWLGGSDSATEGRWLWSEGNAEFFRVTAYRNWCGTCSPPEPNDFTTNPGSRMLPVEGTWVDTPATTGDFPYICEDPAPVPLQTAKPTATTPQVLDVFSAKRQFTGNTQGVGTPTQDTESVGGIMVGCSDASAGDAVFSMNLPFAASVTVDLAGSFAGAVVGLLKTNFGVTAYADAGSVCATVASPRTVMNLPAGQYYWVVTGNAPSASGTYNVTFSAVAGAAAFVMKNDTPAQASSSPIGTVDNKWVVKTSNLADLTPTIGTVSTLNGQSVNNDVNARSLGNINNNQIVVENATTTGYQANYPRGTCSAPAPADGPDALYSFTAVDADPIQIRLKPVDPTPSFSGNIIVLDGAPSTSGPPPLPISLTPGNANETPTNGEMVSIGQAQPYLGNLTMMANDVPAAAFNQSFNNGGGTCSADAAGSDAFFRFTLSTAQTVEISSANTAVPHTIALWDANKRFVRPSPTPNTQWDTRVAASSPLARLLGGTDIDDDWVVVGGSTAMLTPFNPVTTWTEVTGTPTTNQYKRDDNAHVLGNVAGKQFVTSRATTTGLAGDYNAATLQCGGSSNSAPDALFRFNHATGGNVRISLNNPSPAFAANVALFKGDPSTAAAMAPPPNENVPNTNEAWTSAYTLMSPAYPDAAKTFSGNTSAMVNNYAGSVFTQGSAYGSRVCNPDAAGKDAFIKFTVDATKTVEISSQSASFDQTIALWDDSPIVAPAAAALSPDTRRAAFSSTLGALENQWYVRTATMSGLQPGALTARAVTAASSNRDDFLDLGNPGGQVVTVSNDNTTTGVTADFPYTTLGCGNSDTPADVYYKIKPTANTRIRAALNNPSNPSWSAAIAILDGGTAGSPKKPQRFVDTTPAAASTSYCTAAGFAYTPSNFTVGTGAGQANFATAPTVSLTCGGTVTFNSSTNTWTGYCSGQTQPTPVVKTQSGGPDLVILPFKAFTLGSTTTIKLLGSRPVAFAVEGNATIQGTIDTTPAMGSTTWGAGAEWSCGASTGGAGLGNGSLRGGGGGGGGFGTRGGYGGMDDGKADAAGGGPGVVRGNATLVPLYGGCLGGKGHQCSTKPGGGGGAVQISAGLTLTVSGTISANGANGQDASCNDSGGEGGGSGGAILLEAATINKTGTVRANGGNGGKSQDSTLGGVGSTSSATMGADGKPGDGDGAGAGGGGYGRIYERVVACVPPNDTFGTAVTVPVGLAQTFNGPIKPMGADVTTTAFKPVTATCAPNSTGPDAFWKFTIARPTTVEFKATGSGFDHTLSYFNSAMAAQNCVDGTAASGATLTMTNLAAGTYYVGIKSKVAQATVTGNYNVAIRDTSAGVTPYANSLACATTANAATVDANVVAGNEYYIIVKGAAAGASGNYNLTVTDIGQVYDYGCGTDLSAPDAYFDFELTSTRNVTVSLNETAGKLNGSFVLMRDVTPFATGSADNTTTDTIVGACQASSFTYSALPAGRYYVIVRGMTVVGGAGRLPAEVTIRDDSGMNALDCMNTASGATGTITRTLTPGTYYTGITSRNGAAGGAYKLQIRDTAVTTGGGGGGGTWVKCADSNYNIDATLDAGADYSVVVKGASGTVSGAYTLTVTDSGSVQDKCDPADTIQMDPTAPDAYYAFTVTDPNANGQDVTVSLASTSALDGVYRLFKTPTHGTQGTAVGSCHDRSAPFTYTDLAAGNYYLALRGRSAASGGANAAFELSVQDRDAYGSMECKNGAATTGDAITRTNLAAGSYVVGIKPQAGAVDPKDYRLTFRDPNVGSGPGSTELACSNSVVNINPTAGKTYHVLVKGYNSTESGNYNLTVTDLGGSSA
jgi:hypothetical protein